MNREEFIGKLQMVYVGDRNAFDEIVEDNQKLKNEVVYSKVEIDRLNNIIDGLEKYIIEEIDDAREELNIILQGNNLDYKNECTKEFNCIKNALDMLLDKLKALKENNNE